MNWLTLAGKLYKDISNEVSFSGKEFLQPEHMNMVEIIFLRKIELDKRWKNNIESLIGKAQLKSPNNKSIEDLKAEIKILESENEIYSDLIVEKIKRLGKLIFTSSNKVKKSAKATIKITTRYEKVITPRSSKELIPISNKLERRKPIYKPPIPYSFTAIHVSRSNCIVCKAKLLDLVCTQCRNYICPRCGTCSTTCLAREERRKVISYSAFKPSRESLVSEEDWIIRKKRHKSELGRASDFEASARKK